MPGVNLPTDCRFQLRFPSYPLGTADATKRRTQQKGAERCALRLSLLRGNQAFRNFAPKAAKPIMANPSKATVVPLSGTRFGKVPNSSNEEFAFENPAYRITLPLVVAPNAAVGMSIWTSANPLPGFTSVIVISWAPRLQANNVN